jgi:hypothetical protein
VTFYGENGFILLFQLLLMFSTSNDDFTILIPLGLPVIRSGSELCATLEGVSGKYNNNLINQTI